MYAIFLIDTLPFYNQDEYVATYTNLLKIIND